MTDPQTNSAADDKNPLDILEELLKDSGGSGGPSGGSSAPDASKQAELSEEELAQKRAELEQRQVAQEEDDAVKLAQQQELLKTLKDTPEYQARVQQDTEKADEDDQAVRAGDGYEVLQLKHDKIY